MVRTERAGVRRWQRAVRDKAASYETGACEGDSGGPLLATWPSNGSLVEIGVTIHVYGECSTTHPTVFTHADLISSWAHEWIEAVKPPPAPAPPSPTPTPPVKSTPPASPPPSKPPLAKPSPAKPAPSPPPPLEGVYRGATSQSQAPIALVAGAGGKRITAITTTITYYCHDGHTLSEPLNALSNYEPEELRADHSFSGTFNGNPLDAITGTFNAQAGTVSGSLAGVYDTHRYGSCSTGNVTWSAQRQATAAATAKLAAPGSYTGWSETGRMGITVSANGRELVGLHFSAAYQCPHSHRLHSTWSFLSSRDTQALESFGTFTMFVIGSDHYRGRVDGVLGLAPGSAFGTLEASTGSRFGKCQTGLVYWQASLAH